VNRENIMGPRVCVTPGLCLALVAFIVAVGLLVLPTQARAVVTCPATNPTADSDGDGFTDGQECAGLTLPQGMALLDGTTFVPSCLAVPTAPRSSCLDPNTKDVFVIVVRAAAGSLLPAVNLFGNVMFNGVTFNGLADLGVTAHQITSTAVGRAVTSAQNAVRLAESLDTSDTILGVCSWGTPNELDGCVVYTQRIKNFIDSVCNSAGDTTTNRTDVLNAYAVHTALHETGHTLGGLTASYSKRNGGNHYASGSGLIMEQSETYSTKGGVCTWNITSRWNLTLDPPAVQLK
jgi:hypothetical protein